MHRRGSNRKEGKNEYVGGEESDKKVRNRKKERKKERKEWKEKARHSPVRPL